MPHHVFYCPKELIARAVFAGQGVRIPILRCILIDFPAEKTNAFLDFDLRDSPIHLAPSSLMPPPANTPHTPKDRRSTHTFPQTARPRPSSHPPPHDLRPHPPAVPSHTADEAAHEAPLHPPPSKRSAIGAYPKALSRETDNDERSAHDARNPHNASCTRSRDAGGIRLPSCAAARRSHSAYRCISSPSPAHTDAGAYAHALASAPLSS